MLSDCLYIKHSTCIKLLILITYQGKIATEGRSQEEIISWYRTQNCLTYT